MSKVSKKDKEVIELKKQFEKKEAEIKALKQSVHKKYKTNLVCTIGQSSTNLNVLNQIGLLELLFKLNGINAEALILGLGDVKVGAYFISEFIHDVTLKIQNIDLVQREKDIQDFKITIESFISEEYKQNEFFDKAKNFLSK